MPAYVEDTDKQPTIYTSFIATNSIKPFQSPHPIIWPQINCTELVMPPGLVSNVREHLICYLFESPLFLQFHTH